MAFPLVSSSGQTIYYVKDLLLSIFLARQHGAIYDCSELCDMTCKLQWLAHTLSVKLLYYAKMHACSIVL